MDDLARPAPLPPREPRSLLLHALVDAAVAFLALVLVLWVLGAPFWATVVVSGLLGAIAAPFTRSAEQRGLASREHRADD